MSKLEKQTTLFIEYKTLKQNIKNGQSFDYPTLGITLNQKIALNKFLYTNPKVIKKPFALLVDKSTYDIDKVIIVDYIINEIIIQMKQLGKSERTISAIIGDLSHFINWIDENKIKILKNIEYAREGFILYTKFLKNKIRDSSYSASTASKKQIVALRMLKSIHNDKKNFIIAQIKLIQRGEAKHTIISLEKDKIYQFNFYSKLFDELSDFLLEEKEYPYILNLHKKDIWIIPQQPIFLAGHEGYHINTFDHINGLIRTHTQLIENFNYASSQSARTVKDDFARRLKRNNSNYKTPEKFELASIALKAYYMTFIALTGMNDSTAATLAWDDTYIQEKKQHKFRNIKYRANGKIVEFTLEKKFIKSFEKYVKIRHYLLDGNHSNYLFFKGYGLKVHLSSVQKSGHFVKEINNYVIKKIDPYLPKINAREMRVNKIHIIMKDKGILAASEAAQSSISNVISNYTGEPQNSVTTQFEGYFNMLNKNIILDKDEIETSISVGSCRDIGNPNTNVDAKAINVNCRQFEGCLFCDKYCIHIDEIDIRKLHSLHFIIEETRNVSNDINHFLSIYGSVLERIANIFLEMIQINPENTHLIEKIRNDVFEYENLDPYWENKFTMLIKIGVLK